MSNIQLQRRVITADKAASCQHWQLPTVGYLTKEQMCEQQQKQLQQGFDKGYQDGLAEAKSHVQGLVSSLGSIQNFLHESDNAVEQEIILLARELAMTLLKREVSTDEQAIITVVQQAMRELPSAVRTATIRLAPTDMTVIKKTAILEKDPERGWELIEDNTVHPGGCVIHSEVAELDASLETRLDRVLSTLLQDVAKTSEE